MSYSPLVKNFTPEDNRQRVNYLIRHQYLELKKRIYEISTAYTVTLEDSTVLADATSAAFTITLPKAYNANGYIFTIKKIDSSANAVTVDGDGAETIDGATTQVISFQYDSVTVQSDGTEWWIL